MTQHTVEFLQQGLNSDALLYCCLLAISTALLRVLPLPEWSKLWAGATGVVKRELQGPGPYSVETAGHAFASYRRSALADVERMRASYKKLSWAHRSAAASINYGAKLDKLAEVTKINARITNAIAELAAETHQLDSKSWTRRTGGALDRTRESLRHFVRDWSEEGADERRRIFGPILGVLDDVPLADRGNMRVLVPGCGLGRLAWEIHQLGFHTTANELSYYMNLSLQFLLDPKETPRRNTHSIHPYAHWFSHQRSNDRLFRSVPFPDTLPRLTSRFQLSEGDFFRLYSPAPLEDDRKPHGYDIIVTLFFIDTSLNIVRTLQHIYDLLTPGGTWINLGPLLWTAGAEAAMELSLDEVKALAKDIGFNVMSVEGKGGYPVPEKMRPRTVECEYTADKTAMMRWLYQAEFWVAIKPE